MYEEEAVWVVFLFDFGEAGVVGAPVGMLEVGLEEVAFRDVGSSVGGDGGQVGWVVWGFESLWMPASLLQDDSQEKLANALF